MLTLAQLIVDRLVILVLLYWKSHNTLKAGCNVGVKRQLDGHVHLKVVIYSQNMDQIKTLLVQWGRCECAAKYMCSVVYSDEGLYV